MRGYRYLAVVALAGVPLLGMSWPSPAGSAGDRAGSAVERRVDIPPGTTIPVTLDEDIPVKQDQVGQTFPAHVTRDVTVNGSVVVPEGSPARVKLVPSEESNGNATLHLAEVKANGKTQSVNTSDARADTKRSHEGLGKKTGIGAAAGAVIGAIAGGGGGLVKGAIVGAGGGLAWGFLGGGKEIGKNTQLEFSVK